MKYSQEKSYNEKVSINATNWLS